MLTVYPDYYKKFNCKKEKCRHNCCVGWEIDIDDEKLKYYQSLDGILGEKLKNNISLEKTPHFILDKHERCPFLNQNNLCELIINLGADSLCSICDLHPRFQNELPHRNEIGLGLCCEAACELIIANKNRVSLIGHQKSDDPIIVLRDKVISILQDRNFNIDTRIKNMLKLCKTEFEFTASYFNLFLSLERLDKKWTELLLYTQGAYKQLNFQKFDTYIKPREYEYEQFLVYLIYRHFANSSDIYSAAAKASFAALSYYLIHSIGAALLENQGEFSFDMQADIMRMFSAEIEYSDENLYTLFEAFL